jgi:glycosyltransferase involved in cell wall biosynthesis
MRVVIVGPAPPLRGGIAKHTAGLADGLRGRGHSVYVASYSRLYPQRYFPGRRQVDGATAVGDALIDNLDPLSWVRARRRVVAAQPDLVVAQWWHPCAIPALATVLPGLDCPVVLMCHNARPHGGFPGWRLWSRIALRACDLAVCHSRAVTEQIARLSPSVGRLTVPMPVLVAPPRVTRPTRDPARPHVLFAGLIRRYKALDVLLEAWDRARLPAACRLTIVGESYLGPGRVESMVAAIGRRASIAVTERYVSDQELWSLLLSAHTMVLPYAQASQSGLVPLGLAAGLRVIATDAGGLAEPLRCEHGHRIIGTGDSAALAEAIEEIVWQAMTARDAVQQPEPAIEQVYLDSWRRTLEACEAAAARVGN